MIEEPTYILDTPLPDALNFKVLRDSGIYQLKNLVGQVWSNYNETDPGVTILEQLCYALTELGYCAQFPIEDVLTDENGKIRYEGQFFKPEEILTCAPVTADDYRKLVHDRFEAVEAIYLTAETFSGQDDQPWPTGCHISYLHLRSGLSQLESEQLVRQVHEWLNRHRNLAEVFALPRVLSPRKIELAGSILLLASADITHVHSQILQVLKAYGLPPVIRSGYQQLRDQGVAADEIFNGPKLENGWISGPSALGSKTDTINLFDLNTLLTGIDGVAQVQGLVFLGETDDAEIIDIAPDQIADIDASNLAVVRNTLSHPVQDGLVYLSRMRGRHNAANVESRVDRYPVLPQGSYRNIEQYYSVQNTFPDIYGIGQNSLESDLPSYRVASSRQLKGYLLVFDQLLANQFSQLAHVGDLFSFMPNIQPSSPGAFHGGGLAYTPFSTTYYCQPLYSVPDVMPLLRGNEVYRLQVDPTQPGRLVDREAWKRYRQQPFNAYMQGLRDSMERASHAEQRRDNMLSHLMARHGEQASLYNDTIRLCHWYGSEARTRIVVKSIWLQNYPMLSYYHASAFNPLQASRLAALPDNGIPLSPPRLSGYPTVDGLLDEALVYTRSRLTLADFAHYSTFELKANILLGVSEYLSALAEKVADLLDAQDFSAWLASPSTPYYRLANSDISVHCVEGQHRVYEGPQQLMYVACPATGAVSKGDYRLHMDQLNWLATQRKGFLLIEHVLLLPEREPGVPDTTQGVAGWFLSASLIFPEYVRQDVFKAFSGPLVERHWPEHVQLKPGARSHVALRALISQFVLWHNAIGSPARRSAAARVLARLLKLPPLKEVTRVD